MSNGQLPLIVRPSESLQVVGSAGLRIISEMVGEVLASAHERTASLTPKFRIGGYELCEPDYQQILLWAESLKIEPDVVIERLVTTKEGGKDGKHTSQFINGRIIEIHWDIALLPLEKFEWVEGLGIKLLVLSYDSLHRGRDPVERSLSFRLPELKNLRTSKLRLTQLDLSAVPQLTELWCCGCQLAELDLSAVPQLTGLVCVETQLAELDLSAVSKLEILFCLESQITELNLSAVPQLKQLHCFTNSLTQLDLSAVPQLTALDCSQNQLAELDIRPLHHLESLSYDAYKTRLIKRPDQNF